MITSTATTIMTTSTALEGGIFAIALLIVLLSLKEILDADKKFFSFVPKINTLIFPLTAVFFIIVARTVVEIW